MNIPVTPNTRVLPMDGYTVLLGEYDLRQFSNCTELAAIAKCQPPMSPRWVLTLTDCILFFVQLGDVTLTEEQYDSLPDVVAFQFPERVADTLFGLRVQTIPGSRAFS